MAVHCWVVFVSLSLFLLLSKETNACSDQVDLVILVDTSGSICDDDYTFKHYNYKNCWNFVQVKRFIRELFIHLDHKLGPDGIRIGLIQFGSGADVIWNFQRTNQGVAQLVNALSEKVVYIPNQWTYLADALRLMCDHLFVSHLARPNARKVALVITDGKPDPMQQKEKLKPEIEKLHRNGIRTYAIGITEFVDLQMLREISSPPRILGEQYFQSPITAGIGPPYRALKEDICFPDYNGPTTWSPPGQVGQNHGGQVTQGTPPLELRGICGDVVFLIDASGSICDDDPTMRATGNGDFTCDTWERVKSFLQAMTNELPIDYDLTRVGIVQFGNAPEIIWYLNEGTKKDLLKMRIGNLRYQPYQLTHLTDAIRVTVNDVLNGPGHRPEAVDSIILLTDAIPTEGYQATNSISEARAAHAKSIYIYGVGITYMTDIGLLRQLSSPPQIDYENYFSHPLVQDIETPVSYLSMSLGCSHAGAYYIKSTRTTTATTTYRPYRPYTPPPAPPPSFLYPQNTGAPCGMDLVIMVDISGSVCDNDSGFLQYGISNCQSFKLLKEFLSNLVNSLNFDSRYVTDSVALITFNNTAKIQWQLDSYQDAYNMQHVIKNLQYIPYQTTNLAMALGTARSVFSIGNGDRRDRPNVGLIVTDGFQDDRTRAIWEAERSRDRGHMQLVALGITRRVEAEALRLLSSQPQRLGLTYFISNSFEDLPKDASFISDFICERNI